MGIFDFKRKKDKEASADPAEKDSLVVEAAEEKDTPAAEVSAQENSHESSQGESSSSQSTSQESLDAEVTFAAPEKSSKKKKTKSDKDGEDISQEDDAPKQKGPWDIQEDKNIPIADYIDFGVLKVRVIPGVKIELVPTPEGDLLNSVIGTVGSSSVQITIFAAPKSSSLWDSLRQEILEATNGAIEEEGTFGTEVRYGMFINGSPTPIPVRIAGVDGPRWMARGIFTGFAAVNDDKNPEKKKLDKFFSSIVIDRGTEPFAPRDFIPLTITPPANSESDDNQSQEENSENDSAIKDIKKPKGASQNMTQLRSQEEMRDMLQRENLISQVR